MSASSDEYRTIRGEAQASCRVQGSQFVAVASPSRTREEAEEFVEGIRRQYHDATHHCFAYRCGPSGNVFRFNDDGEPSGTAGKPILNAIDRVRLTDLCVVVTRYFGGTKLGVGGLARAYAGAAEQALARADVVTRYELDSFRISFPHRHIGTVMHVASRLGVRITETTYDGEVHLTVEIRRSKTEELRRLLTDHTSGSIRFSS